MELKLRWARAHWVAHDTILWKPFAESSASFLFHAGDESYPLTLDAAGVSEEILARFPHLSGYGPFRLPPAAAGRAREFVRERIGVSATDAAGNLVDASGLQIPGVLDELFPYDGPLGVTFADGVPTLRVWAPTARRVTVMLGPEGRPPARARGRAHAMSFDATTGVWSVTGDRSWKDQFYLYEVEVFVRSSGRVESNLVTDPYSVSLSTNSRSSQIVDLEDPSLKPEGWDALAKPALQQPQDAVLYELHLRDFSIGDVSVPAEHRGTYLAFTHHQSTGMRHLRALARSGLTHVHLLPLFDFASVNDIRAEHKDPGDLSRFPPDSEEQQRAVTAVADQDGFNWGYDPLHYTVPEGSYATDSDGSRRILEFRTMVKALGETGLRVVMDVVYNHTNAASQHEWSVLDRIVPGYYHRLDQDGEVLTTTCCPNTATEHAMMEKLMIDSVLTWARAYKIDGFRFDLMGHHMKSNMVKLRNALGEGRGDAETRGHGDAATQRSGETESDPSPRPRVPPSPRPLIYGEGWDFGEVAHNGRGVNATQLNLRGTGIATFNDRMRDAARGGGPFSGLQEQGFVSGLADSQGEEARARLHYDEELIRIGLAGSLAEFRLAGCRAEEFRFKGQPAGYTADPAEAVNYIAAHDNETLFDAIQLKASRDTPLSERVRLHNLGVSLVLLAQGIPLVHAGDELLRSKSLDRNSYNSGDWFNRLDFARQENTFGSGLPPARENAAYWGVMRPLLGDPALKPSADHIARAFDHFLEMLRIRKSSRLFRLPDAAAVLASVRFHAAEPGVIAMSISQPADRELIVVLFNANQGERTVKLGELAGADLMPHPEQQVSSDQRVGEARVQAAEGRFEVPGRTTAVFWGFRALR
jgi:pullulanase